MSIEMKSPRQQQQQQQQQQHRQQQLLPPPPKTPISAATVNGTTNNDKSLELSLNLGSSAVSFKNRPSQDVINNLKLIADDMASLVSGMNDSISSLSLCVNDSAGGDVMFEDCYDMTGHTLGQGGFATVYRCIHVDNEQEYAVKEILNDNYSVEEGGNNIRREIRALKKLRDGPYVVRLLDTFQEIDKTYMIMEEMNGGDLLQRLCAKQYYEPNPARKLSRTLLEAIKYCHSKCIVHRDIKPENILLLHPDDDTKIKLGDFGCAKQFRLNQCPYQLKTLCGTQAYVAPEILLQNDDDPNHSGYDERCDIWSTGVLIYTMLAGYLPFDGDEDHLPEYIVSGDYEFHDEYWKNVPTSAKQLIQGLLTVDRDQRWTLSQALDEEWLRRYQSSHSNKSSTFGPTSSSSSSSNDHSNKCSVGGGGVVIGSSSSSSVASTASLHDDSERSSSASDSTTSIAAFDLSLGSLVEAENEHKGENDVDDENHNDDETSNHSVGSLGLEDL